MPPVKPMLAKAATKLPTGDDFFYDAQYLAQLKANAGGKIAVIDHPLFIHN